jgi:hypothetical protein
MNPRLPLGRALVEAVRRAPPLGISGEAGTGDPAGQPLPAPVARYLAVAIPSTRFPAIRHARLRQIGTLRTGTGSARWLRFTAEQTVAPEAAAFVWDARVALLPGLQLRVVDALLDGRGAGEVRLFSALRVASDADTPELNAGALHRFLAEAVWYPTALRPSAHLRWSALDERAALATLSAAGVSVALEFRFAPSGEVAGIYTPARWGRFGGRYEQKPWEGRFGGCTTVQGLRVPTHGEVGWYERGTWARVWEGSLREAHFGFEDG